MQTKEVEKNIPSGKEKLDAAKEPFDRMMKEIRPFIKKRDIKTYSTSGEWTVTQEQK
jgi:hypothetical protein